MHQQDAKVNGSTPTFDVHIPLPETALDRPETEIPQLTTSVPCPAQHCFALQFHITPAI